MKAILPFGAALALVAAAPALAQPEPAPAPTAAPATTYAPAPSAEVIQRHQTVLTKTIADMKAGKPDYANMSEQLAAAVRPQEAAIAPALTQLGDLKSLDYQGVVQGALKFKATFANGVTTWIIALGPDGKIHGLVLRGGEE